MVSGATILSLAGQPKGVPMRYNIPNQKAIEKNRVLVMSGADARESSSTDSGANAVFLGISSTEKVANDGSTSIGAWTKGNFGFAVAPMKGSISGGHMVSLSGQNLVRPATAGEILTGSVIGRSISGDKTENANISVAIGIY